MLHFVDTSEAINILGKYALAYSHPRLQMCRINSSGNVSIVRLENKSFSAYNTDYGIWALASHNPHIAHKILFCSTLLPGDEDNLVVLSEQDVKHIFELREMSAFTENSCIDVIPTTLDNLWYDLLSEPGQPKEPE